MVAPATGTTATTPPAAEAETEAAVVQPVAPKAKPTVEALVGGSIAVEKQIDSYRMKPVTEGAEDYSSLALESTGGVLNGFTVDLHAGATIGDQSGAYVLLDGSYTQGQLVYTNDHNVNNTELINMSSGRWSLSANGGGYAGHFWAGGRAGVAWQHMGDSNGTFFSHDTKEGKVLFGYSSDFNFGDKDRNVQSPLLTLPVELEVGLGTGKRHTGISASLYAGINPTIGHTAETQNQPGDFVRSQFEDPNQRLSSDLVSKGYLQPYVGLKVGGDIPLKPIGDFFGKMFEVGAASEKGKKDAAKNAGDGSKN